ncbi:hypothetical protein CK203_048609 [Vitis vinifera]|uniref:Retrotransposon gag domain-containing protein n=1 Tax=Vitis vinifera TaxID=29760 RepID=A0A438HK51_VITVI|nr:hypothetical protein CK203_048609 [Vitis vinifera]
MDQDNPNAFRSMRDRMHPPRMSAPSCIVPPTEQLVIRPHIVPLLPTFHGMESENPMHISRNLKITNGLKRQISNFSAKENEKFYECWERYMEAINACPHHGFDTWLLNPEEAMDFLSYVAEVQGDGMNRTKENKFAAMTRRLEELELKKIHEVQAVAETPVQVKPCPICQSYEHLVEECPTIPAAREMFGDQANVIGQFKPNNNASYGNTYN